MRKVRQVIRALKRHLAARKLARLIAKRKASLDTNPHRQAALKGWATRKAA